MFQICSLPYLAHSGPVVPFRAAIWLFRLSTTARPSRAPDGDPKVQRPYPIHPDQMTPAIRGAECPALPGTKVGVGRMSRENGVNPDIMSVDSRLSELGRIVAAGIIRMRQQSSPLSAENGESSLAILPTRSVSRSRARARIGGR